MKKVIAVTLCSILIVLSVLTVIAAGGDDSGNKTLAFPGAEGYGAYASGGRGGEVYEVTNLNDSGPGSFRDAVSKSNRTVVFRTSGTIELKSHLKIQGNITIAGQTAPGDGICVKGYSTEIAGNNVIMRYIRFRLGYDNKNKSDAFDVNGVENIIIDHCSFSWGVDENISVYGNKNLTIQWCIISEGLNIVNHSCGGLWGSQSSYHHNLFAHNKTRNPKFAYLDGGTIDFRNNVIYDWGEMSVYTGSNGNINMVSNYYKSGPSTKSSVKNVIVQPDKSLNLFCKDNYVVGFPDITTDNWNGGIDGQCNRVDTPFNTPPVTTQTAEDAYKSVLSDAGATLPKRDAVDTRIINDVINGTGSIINDPNAVGGWPVLNSANPPLDTDHDGMPDEWEKSKKLNPNDPNDRNEDRDGNGYTNLEEYLNSLVSKNSLAASNVSALGSPSASEENSSIVKKGSLTPIAVVALSVLVVLAAAGFFIYKRCRKV